MSRVTTDSSFNVRPDKHTLDQINALTPELGSIVFDTDSNVNKYWNGVSWEAISGASPIDEALDNRIVVNQINYLTTIGGVIDSSKQYFIDGIVDMGTTQITVPVGGINVNGHSFNLSALVSTEDNYTLFSSETDIIGSGFVILSNFTISINGLNSKVYDLVDSNGTNGLSFDSLYYVGCTSLGNLTGFRQGIESNTIRAAGSPSLTFSGLWSSGYRVSSSIAGDFSGTVTEPLFKEGILFQMNGRFLTDISCDLGALGSLCDFKPLNFPNESTVQFKGVIITRDGSSNSEDVNITPNLSASDLACDWDGNIGMNNTFIGGVLTNTVEAETTIGVAGVGVDMAGTWAASDLQHFDSPASNELRHLGSDPKDFRINFSFVVDGGQNDNVAIELVKVDGFATPSIEFTQRRVINNIQGNRDVAYFTGSFNIRMNKNDFVVWQITNITDNTNVTLEQDSSWIIEER